jgi:hypothetical protein
MSLDLTILQKPLDVCESHSDHTWNVALNDYSAYTDIRLVVDVYSNPYSNDQGSNSGSGKKARLLIPVNQYGNCIFNVETIIRNFTKANPRNTTMVYDPTGPSAQTNNYLTYVMNDNGFQVTGLTNQATINNARPSTIAFSNGFNGVQDGYEEIYHINEYRLIFGVQYSVLGVSTIIIDDVNWNVYEGWDNEPIDPAVAATQPYGCMIYPGVQDNKVVGYSTNPNFNPYYTTDPSFNYHNTKVYAYAMNQGVAPYNQDGQFMATFGDEETIPMTIFGDTNNVYQTRWRTHYYDCPILIPFMYGENPMYNNSDYISSINYLLKTQGNGQYNYDVSQTLPISFTPGAPYYSYLGQRIAYGVYKQNPNYLEQSDVAIFLSSGTCDPSGVDRVSEIVQYKMVGKECFNDPYSFLFLNRQGVWDTYTFTKKSNKTYLPKKKTYSSYKTLNTTVWNRQSYDSSQTVYYGVAEEMFVFDSGFVNQNDRQIIEDLLMSPYLYMIMNNYTPQQGQTEIFPFLIPCVVQDKEVKVFQQKYQRIYQYTLEVKQTPYRQYFTPF